MRFGLLTVILLASGLPTLAQSGAEAPQIPFTQFTLPNGLRVILSEDHSLPVVTESMLFNIGGRQEHPGRSGFAHLFEHLMFEGSEHAPKGVFDHLVEGYGGTDNASTHEDYTFYFETAPSNALPLLAWLDADRLAHLDVTPANLKNQISVVEEEKRLRVDNEPYGPLEYLAISAQSFSNWQNAHPVIGSFEDLNAATLPDVKAFFNAYYAPRNGVLAIVGDMDPVQTRGLITRYFGQIPDRGTIVPVNTVEPPRTAEKHVIMHDAHANLPALAIAWQGPSRDSPDFYALTMLGELLFDGESSRLYQSLVKTRKVALSVDGGLGFPEADYTDYRAPGLFSALVVYKNNVPKVEGTTSTEDLVEQLIFREIHDMVANGVPAEELDRARTRMRANWIRSEQTTLDRSQLLALSALLNGDPGAANTELNKYLQVKSSDIARAALQYLTHPRATVIVDLPGAQAPSGPSPKELR